MYIFYLYPSVSGSIHIFILAACGIGGIDLIFVVDESGSIGEPSFQLFREFIENVSSVINFGQSNSRVAIISFDDSPHLVFNLHQYTDRPSFVQAVRGLPYNGGGTDIAEALNFLRETAQNGSLGINDNNRQIVMFMTDGQSDAEATMVAATALHDANIFRVYAIGVSGANVSQLNVIAGGNSDFVFYSNTFDSAVLRRIEAEVIEELCTGKYVGLKWLSIYTYVYIYTYIRMVPLKCNVALARKYLTWISMLFSLQVLAQILR